MVVLFLFILIAFPFVVVGGIKILKEVSGVEVPIPTYPVEPSTERAVNVEVAKVDGDEVAKYKKPPAVLILHWFEVKDASVSLICEALDEEMVNAEFIPGVEVPIPKALIELSKKNVLSPD